MILPNRYTYVGACSFLMELDEEMDKYGVITIADIFDMQARDNPNLDISKLTYRANMAGWCKDNLKSEFVKDEHGSYRIKLGRALPIE